MGETRNLSRIVKVHTHIDMFVRGMHEESTHRGVIMTEPPTKQLVPL